jgi:hypothetical protein
MQITQHIRAIYLAEEGRFRLTIGDDIERSHVLIEMVPREFCRLVEYLNTVWESYTQNGHR